MDRAARARAGASSAWALGLLFFLFYAARLCPDLSLTGDSGELVTAAAVWGVPHAPGYPLFTAIGHAFTWLPIHTIPWRVHLTSAVFHAGAITATSLATLSITKDRIASLAAGCALGLQRSFLLGSLYAEVFPLNDLLFATLLLVAVRLRSRETGPLTFAGVAGLAAAHHMMIALAAPAVAILALEPLRVHLRDRAQAPRRAAALLVALVGPALIAYLLIPLAAAREPALSWGDVHDARSLLALVTRRDYGGLLSSVHGIGHGTGGERIAALVGLLGAGFGTVSLVVATGGFGRLLREQRATGVAIALAAITSGPGFAYLNALGTGSEAELAFFERFSTMCTVPIAIAIGAGVAALNDAIPAGLPARLGGALALTGWLVASALQVRGVDLHDDLRGIAFAHDLVLPTPDRSLLLVSGDAAANGALYVCAVEQRCEDRVVLAPGGLFLPWAMAQFRRRHPDVDIPWASGPALKRTHEIAVVAARARPVFAYPDLLEKDPLLAETMTPFPDHLLFRLWPHEEDAGNEDRAFLASVQSLVGNGTCAGCALPVPASHPTQAIQLLLAYQAAALNHARFADRVPEARPLIPALLVRAGDPAQRGGESMSRKSSSWSR